MTAQEVCRGLICVRIAKVGLWHVSDDEEGGKASRLCPSNSDVDLFGYGESVIDFDAEIPDSALDLRMPQQSCAIIRILLSH
jgi:hypothetical protein